MRAPPDHWLQEADRQIRYHGISVLRRVPFCERERVIDRQTERQKERERESFIRNDP